MRPRSAPAYSPNETARSNSGSKSRQPWQRPSPTSNCDGNRRSPHCTHCGVRMGPMESRHSGHTGRREMFTRGTPQSLQSEGKRTEKMLCTAVTIGATRDVRCSARPGRRCRLRIARLLKTTLQSMVLAGPVRAHPPYRGRKHRGHQYIGLSHEAQCGGRLLNRDAPAFRAMRAVRRPRFDRFDWSQLRRVLRAKMKVSLACTCTKYARHANLRRHSYLGYTRGLPI